MRMMPSSRMMLLSPLWLPLLLLLLLPCLQDVNVLVTAQQAPNPSLQIPPFQSTPTFRHNFCNLSQSSNATNIGSILDGQALNAVVLLGEFTNFDTQYDGDGNVVNRTLNKDYAGLAPSLLDAICERAGCTWRNSFGIIDSLPANRTYSDLLIWTTDVYDISVDWWMRSTDRMRAGATFTEGWYDASIIMVTKQQDADDKGFDGLSWLSPFDYYVWMMVVITILVSAVIYWCLEVLNPDTDLRKDQLDPIETVWMLGTAFAGQFEFDPQTGPARLFTFSIAFWALLMGAAYTANLASFLVVRNTPQLQIESVEQAVRMNIPMCVWKGSLTEQTVRDRFPAYARSGLLIPTSQRGVYEGVREGKCPIGITEVSSWKTFQYDKTINGDCSLYWIGRAFDFIPASFAVKADSGIYCTSLVRTVFDLHLHDMQKEGRIAELWEQHNQQTATVFCQGQSSGGGGDDDDSSGRRLLHTDDFQHHRRAPSPVESVDANGNHRRHLKAAKNSASASDGGGDDDEDTPQLTLNNMGGVFLLHGILSMLALFFALISWGRKKYAQRRKARKQGMDGEQDFGDGDAESSLDNDEFFDASTTAEEFRRKMATKVSLGAASNNTHTTAALGMDGTSINSSINGGGAAVEDLRLEMNQKLKSIDQKLAALLEKKDR